MLFNSINFAIFLTVVFLLYWFVTSKNLTLQNLLLLAASYYFYACWDLRLLLLLLFSTLVNFFLGKQIDNTAEPARKQLWLWIGILLNIGLLIAARYSSLLADLLARIVSVFPLGKPFPAVMTTVGISFYTFCELSYLIDIYRKRIRPANNYLEYSVFTSFFPLIIAGPIERATHLLPQIQKPRTFDEEKAVDGLRQILWGLFKKMVIADGCAEIVNRVFQNPAGYSGSTLVLGALLFAFQIYADFSGYSDMALGTARLLGIDLLQNFAFPYFSRDIAEFWRRWHISLSTWFRDYVFYPLERRRLPVFGQSINILILFLLTGLWHGLSWTFLIWGGLNAVYFLVFLRFNKSRNRSEVVAQGSLLPTFRELAQVGTTFAFTTLAWIFFRAADLHQALLYLSRIVSLSSFHAPEILPIKLLTLIAFFVVVEWLGREQKYAIAQLGMNWPKPVRWAIYYSLIFLTLYFSGTQQQFIYAQF